MVTNQISDKAKIGKNVSMWHFTYVGDDVEIGDNVKIGSLAHIDYNVKIGENTKIEGQVYLPPLYQEWKKCVHWTKCSFNK